ncbi:hypothetical protein QBC38DRAFT_439752 [Podospora fimiseda]|uniref:AAA+ ATPase domain-containing protein n=1 Tax=Podospora fimiseda TaxID=252190 RepID=A0AAN7BY06_9PEZI|nr:hypothetical protein QBC38DRAFT_439752 [Podospora fimiseda]
MSVYGSDTSSTTSYEEIRRRGKDEKAQEGEVFEVPDVLYKTELHSASGRVVESCSGPKPFDKLPWDGPNVQDGKSPVIEIYTRIRQPYGRNHSPDYDPRRDYYNDSDSEDDESDRVTADMNDHRKLIKTEMIVHSKHLQAALTAVVTYYPGFDRFHDTYRIEAPYQVLVHHREALEHLKLNQPSCHDTEYAATMAKHIDILLNFIVETHSEQLALEAKRWDNPSGATATFDLFWVLLKPGDIVYREKYGCMTPFVVHNVTKMVGTDGRQNGYLVVMWNVTYSSNRLQRRTVQTVVPPWTGERVIDTLSIVPARFMPGGGRAIAEKQIRLGRTYWELAKQPAYREYNGQFLTGRDGEGGGIITGRVIVDCEGFARFGRGPSAYNNHMLGGRPPRRGPPPPARDLLPQVVSRCSCSACARAGVKQGPSLWAGFDKADPKKEETLPPNQDLFFHIMGPSIPAFILSERRWGKVLVSALSDVKPDQDAFKYLVLDPEIKLTVKAMIGKFASQDGKLAPWPSDFVKNKGEGRIFLLHGSPGVGKTCTAECAAELARRPLLALTSGDISTSMNASVVEGALNYFLKLGERFGALVLLDEADVYLEQRRTRDLKRNGLVSVFLRALEYYKGVLFLTTNRVEAFDDAFTSRIHVTLHYKKLGERERTRIWMHNFERLERDSNNKVFIPQSTKEFAYDSPEMRALRWNGREIRNALQTAVALAETEATDGALETITVQDRHLKAVVKMSSGFKNFLSKSRAGHIMEEEDEELAALLADDDGNDGKGSGEEEESDEEESDDRLLWLFLSFAYREDNEFIVQPQLKPFPGCNYGPGPCQGIGPRQPQLQDYKLQLQLLEAANKRRLEIARREQQRGRR